MTLPRLCDATLGALKSDVVRPAYDRGAVEIGVVHFGPGAFHRAHQAVYFDRLLARDPRWAICGVSLRTPGVRDALAPQDGLYGLTLLDGRSAWRVVGAVKELLLAREAPERVFARLLRPETRLVTLTITEKGYGLAPNGGLDFDHPDIRHDLSASNAPCSAVGWLVEGLRRRRAAGLAPFAVMSCDNLPDNGRKLARAVTAFAARGDPDFARWIEGEVYFPSTMVDAITPAADDALQAGAAEALGLADAAPVQREAFSRWVIEDGVRGEGPDWVSVGVRVTGDVAGYARAKLRLLNGAHSTLAYMGLLRGHTTVCEAMSDGELAAFVRILMVEDIAPTLSGPRGFDAADYIEALLARLRNRALRHQLSQIAADGTNKLPLRILETVRDAAAAGRPLARLAVPVAAWMRFVRASARNRTPPVDPLAPALTTIGAATTGVGRHDAPRFLALDGVFDTVAGLPDYATALAAAYDALGDRGTLAESRR